VALRCNQRRTYQRIERVDLSRNAVLRACKRASPGELLHMDTKKRHRFDQPVHHGHSRPGREHPYQRLLAALRYNKTLG